MAAPKFRCFVHTVGVNDRVFLADGRRIVPQARVQLVWKGRSPSEHFAFKDVVMKWAKESCLGAVHFAGSKTSTPANGVWCVLHFSFELLEDVATFKLTWC